MQAFQKKYNEFVEKYRMFRLKQEWFHQKFTFCVELIEEKIIEKELANWMELDV